MEIAVHRLEARYHLPSSRVADRARLDRLLPEVFEAALELAFERQGVPTEGELLIREIAVPVELRLAQGDGRLLVDWADAVAAAVAAALATGDERKVVAYPHRRRALVAFAEDVARGRRERMWAFERLGFVPADAGESDEETALGLARALAGAPEGLVPLLEELGKKELLPALVARFEPEWWPELASRALVALGRGAAIGLLEESRDPRPLPPAVAGRLRRALAGSTLGRAAAEQPNPARRALLLLAVAAADPGLVPGLEGTAWEAEVAPGRDSREVPTPETAGTSTVLGPVPEVSAGSETHPPVEDPAVLPPYPARPLLPSSSTDLVSDFGGLLFLLGLVDALGIPDELAAIERPFRWSLHRLGLTLVPAEPADPALLAFCGSPPDGPVPFPDEPPPSAAEAEIFAALSTRVAAGLAAALDEPEPSVDLVTRVARRRARFVADPGWIEVHLSLDEVSTAVRRAGLDLDPGFLPWLGAVVRFVYG